MADLAEKLYGKFKEFIDDGKNELSKVKTPKDAIKQLPNVFTISRIFLIPFIIGNMMVGNMFVAGGLALAASATDLVDGKLARKLNATSKFGANLDAVVDKVFITSISIPLFFTNPSLIVPFAMDLVIGSINGYTHIQGYESKTNAVGKMKTVLLDSLIITTLFSQVPFFKTLTSVLLYPTILMQGIAATEYFVNFESQKNKKDIDDFLMKLHENEEEKQLEKTNEKTQVQEKTNDKSKNEEIIQDLEKYKQLLCKQDEITIEEKQKALKKD